MEPTVLPARYPNLLINGSSGIAVGMATNIPPHNLKEVVGATVMLIEDPKVSIERLMEVVPGPDFPTGGFIYGREGIKSVYQTGRGSIRLRARATIEEHEKTGKNIIVIHELPYQTNKARLIEIIADMIKGGRIEGISDLRDESDREGLRVVIELKKDGEAKIILNQLYKHTPMQITFGAILLAVTHGQPMILNLKEILSNFIVYRKEVVTKRTTFELRKAKERRHILEGLNVALENLEETILIIKTAKGPQEAKKELIGRFSFDEIQAQAILDMRLQRLTGLEREKILNEYRETQQLVAKLERILADEKLVLEIIKEELKELGKFFGDERRTEILEDTGEIDLEDMIVEEDMVVTISHTGYIKRTPASLYASQRRGGKGKVGMRMKEEDFIEHFFVASTHNYILFFTNKGRVYWLKVYRVPQGGRDSKGKAIVNILAMGSGEKAVAMLPLREFEHGKYIIMATRKGVVKKTELIAYSKPRAGGIIGQAVDPGDELISAKLTDGRREIFLGSKKGKSIRFDESEIRSVGRIARGVRGMSLREDDELVSMEIVNEGATLLTVTENGFGKRTRNSEYRRQKRGGGGLITNKITDRTGNVVGIKQLMDDNHLMLVTTSGKIIRMRAKDISVFGRNSQGVKLMEMHEGQKVKDIARLAENGENGEEGCG
jgi:DNA gyrase subunit A